MPDDRIDDPPALLDLVGADEEGCIADQRVEHEALVGLG
jgi:hypothetical protein